MNHIGNKPVVLTHGGHYVSLTDPRLDTIYIEDIAFALSRICRYTGHTDRFYSVAEHSVRCASYLRKLGYTPMAQMAALLHDASEAYLGDVSSPLKSLLPGYKVLEGWMEEVIELRFRVSIKSRPEVKMADMQLLSTERAELFVNDQTPWACIADIDPKNYRHSPLGWDIAKAEEMFLRAYEKLEREIAELDPNRRGDVRP